VCSLPATVAREPTGAEVDTPFRGSRLGAAGPIHDVMSVETRLLEHWRRERARRRWDRHPAADDARAAAPRRDRVVTQLRPKVAHLPLDDR